MRRIVKKFHARLTAEEAEQICRVTIFFNMVAIVMLLVFAIVSHMNNNPFHALILISATVLVISNLFVFLKKGRMAPFILSTCILYLALCAYLQITGGDGNTGILWHYVYPIMVYYIAGIHVGSLFAAILLLMESFLMMFDGLFPFQVQYALVFKMRFMATMVVMSVFGAMLEYSRFRAQKKLRNLADKFHAASQTDELTGLANRRALKEKLADEVVRSERSKKDFVLLMYDIDYFKKINDQYGHDVGDMALKHLANCFKENLRGYDIPSRWGGEEFLLLLPETDPDKGVKVAERIRKTVSETPLQLDTGEKIYLNLSCGGSSWMGCRDVETLVKKADDRLYTAKQKGRNRVVWDG